MKITFLGTGPSHGVPIIGCSCPVCTSHDIRNKRFRASVFIETSNTNILIDTPPEFRLQAINNSINHIDGVLFTHQHADHVHGFDDLRRFNEMQRKQIPCYANQDTVYGLKNMYDYVFRGGDLYASSPQVSLRPISGDFCFKNIIIEPIPILHGANKILGYKIDNFAYLTDCSFIPQNSFEKLKDLELLTIGALRYKSHPNHFNLEQAVSTIKELNPKKAFLTHMTHSFDYYQLEKELPPNISPAYDGLIFEL
ncbi:MBL fold metallo-hydrolase [Natranaerobius trueperi]|uniref:MBL fold metallo-hydrolase n=1 Tax=Natranaerobius trueperi TaxID=759412 RepID=A0A226C003_9FIRM|nr:MBL fold metallo-hydrolase [Natranaerobius trueperi]OWZ84525.1 MBL fold metallo-hydrolase [Natranaerobius trueperi]